MLEIKNLTKRYDETIIKNLNIILPSTGLIIIVGNSGCGKTTLLNLIGGIDEGWVEMMSLIKEYKLPNEFPENVLAEARAIPQVIDEKNIEKRVDLRNEEIFTIDGEDAKDLDDAVNVKKNDDRTYTLRDHIAEVS